MSRALRARTAALLCALFLLTALPAVLSGCQSSAAPAGRISVVTTIYPEYDWMRSILGDAADSVDLFLMADNGTDLHSFQPSVADVARISSCDLFVYVGGESDKWVAEALKDPRNPDRIVVRLLDVLGDRARIEETVEGMQSDDEIPEADLEYDEHVWLSLKNAELFVSELSSALGRVDPERKGLYEANARSYADSLKDLDERYAETVRTAKRRTVLFGDRFPFRYLTEDYGLSYYAAFSGCSADSDASFKTVVFLAGKIDELGLPAILILENSDGRIARTVRDNTKSQDPVILVLDSLQSAVLRNGQADRTYLDAMRSNLDVLAQALN